MPYKIHQTYDNYYIEGDWYKSIKHNLDDARAFAFRRCVCDMKKHKGVYRTAYEIMKTDRDFPYIVGRVVGDSRYTYAGDTGIFWIPWKQKEGSYVKGVEPDGTLNDIMYRYSVGDP